MLTVVEEMDPAGPRTWNQAADIAVREIFDSAHKAANLLDTYVRNQSIYKFPGSASVEFFPENEDSMDTTLDLLGVLDDYFNVMVHSMKVMDLDEMFWVYLWRNLGSVSGAIGMDFGAFSIVDEMTLLDMIGPIRRIDIPRTKNDVSDMADTISRILCSKQRDYGKSAISRFGRDGLVIRTHDKIARLKNLLLSNKKPSNESISDTFTDIIGYCALGIMWERGWFNLPFDYDALK